jgi:hypothetical protein
MKEKGNLLPNDNKSVNPANWTHQYLYECTLEWINSVLHEAGKPRLAEIPQGEKGDCVRCPIANALKALLPYRPDLVGVLGHTAYISSMMILLPAYVSEWIQRYDSGHAYQDLVILHA